jgi:hypothetical protein
MYDRMNVTVQNRTAGLVNLDPKNFQSGDQLAIFKVVGNDMLIMWGTGMQTLI